MQALFAIVVGFGLVSLAAMYGAAAWNREMFWPSQVIAKWNQAGIPLALHGAWWGDMLLLPPLCGYLVHKHLDQWYFDGREAWNWPILIGFLITLGNHINLCLNQKVPDPMGWQKEWWSATIAIHFVYMWAVTAIIFHFVLTPGVDMSVVVIVGVVLGLHMMAGIHMPLGILNRVVRSPMLPEFIRTDSAIFAGVLWVAVAGVAWYPGGMGAAVPIAGVGIACVLGVLITMTTTDPLPAH